MRKVIPLIVIAALAAVAVLWWSQQQFGPFYVSGHLESDEIRVGSRVGGRVSSVHVAEGDRVAAGHILVTLEPYDLEKRLAQAEGQLAASQAQFEHMRAGYRAEEIAQARARRDQAQAALDQALAGPRALEIKMLESKLAAARADRAKAEHDFQRVTGLFENQRAAEEELQAATRGVEVARASQTEAEDQLALAREGTRAEEIASARAQLALQSAALELVENGYRAEEVAQAEANVRAAEAAVAVIRQQLAELSISAPAEAVVEAIALQPGDLISPNAPVITLIEAGSLWVRAYVPENRLSVKLGQTVSVRVDAFPDRRFKGEIAYISRQAEFTPANVQTPEERVKQVFRIKVVLKEGHDVLRAGMAADVFLDEPR
ncbi:MAG: efflux RND transporter periplasmic adaptor subunit [Phycisphaerae bacterium]|nr:efflux RND transporter periplasmic adaptor subunit [Phycisphaerae bacterium]